jgi:hypothetical protein
MIMSSTVEWDSCVPPGLRRVLEDLVWGADPDEDGGSLGCLARLLDVSTPAVWGNDVRMWVSHQIEGLEARRVYEFVQELAEGGSTYDKRVSDALASDGIGLEMVDGVFYRCDEVAEELGVDAVLEEPASLLRGRYAPARRQWQDSQQALADRKYELAVGQAVNALESVVRVAAEAKSISAGLKELFPAGERRPLANAIEQLHN